MSSNNKERTKNAHGYVIEYIWMPNRSYDIIYDVQEEYNTPIFNVKELSLKKK